MVAIAFALSSSLLWGLSDYLGGFKSRTFAVPVVLAAMYLSSLLVMLVFVGARGEGPPSSSHVLAALGAGLVGIMALAAFYTRAVDRDDEHRRADRRDRRRAAGDRRPDRRRRARARCAPSGWRSRSSGIVLASREAPRRADRAARAAPEHRAGDRRRPRLRLVLRARRDRLGGRRRLDAAALARRRAFRSSRSSRCWRCAAAARCGRAGARRSRSAGIGLLDLGANAALQPRVDDRRAVERRRRQLAVSGRRP